MGVHFFGPPCIRSINILQHILIWSAGVIFTALFVSVLLRQETIEIYFNNTFKQHIFGLETAH